jgi:hypothetical protein
MQGKCRALSAAILPIGDPDLAGRMASGGINISMSKSDLVEEYTGNKIGTIGIADRGPTAIC